MHDLHRNTAEALPELIRQLEGGGYKVVHMVPKSELTTLPKYDEMVSHQGELASNNTRPENPVVRTHRRFISRQERINTPYRGKTNPIRRTSPHRAASFIAGVSSRARADGGLRRAETAPAVPRTPTRRRR